MDIQACSLSAAVLYVLQYILLLLCKVVGVTKLPQISWHEHAGCRPPRQHVVGVFVPRECSLACIASLLQPVFMQPPSCLLHSIDDCCAKRSTGACVLAAAGTTSLGSRSFYQYVPAPQPQLLSAIAAA